MYISDAEHSKIGHQYSLSTRGTPKTVAPYCRSPLDQELGSPPIQSAQYQWHSIWCSQYLAGSWPSKQTQGRECT